MTALDDAKDRYLKSLDNFLSATIILKMVAEKEQPELLVYFDDLIEKIEDALVVVPMIEDPFLIMREIIEMSNDLDKRIRNEKR